MGDGVICALGMIVGTAAATSDPRAVIMVGLVGGVADAFGNSIGFYISQSAERGVQKNEVRGGKRTRVHTTSENIMNGVASFISTIVIFTIIVAPYLIFPLGTAIWVSFIVGLGMLALLGAYVAGLSRENRLTTALEYAVLGLVGAVVSYLVGYRLGTMLGLQHA